MELRTLADQAVIAYAADEAAALRLATAVRRAGFPWALDVVQAYRAVAVFFDPARTRSGDAIRDVGSLSPSPDAGAPAGGRLYVVPCCYELGPDLERVAGRVGRKPTEVIDLHAAHEYAVYAIGFCPGFPYLGYLPEALCGVPRLERPRPRVPPGSVGLTGRQTGIYTEPRPGGWNLIGRTPLEMVNVGEGYFPLRTGDRVRFRPIGREEFDRLAGWRLPPSDRAASGP